MTSDLREKREEQRFGDDDPPKNVKWGRPVIEDVKEGEVYVLHAFCCSGLTTRVKRVEILDVR